MDVPIAGDCDPAFAPVRDAFAANFAEQGEVGAAVCVIRDGQVVVDLVGGWCDTARTRPWRHETLVDFYAQGYTTSGDDDPDGKGLSLIVGYYRSLKSYRVI